MALATGQLLWAAATLLPFGVAAGRPSGPVTAGPVLAMLALGALGTGVAYVWNYGLIRELGPTAASTVTYLVPVFAVLVGVAFLHEPLTWNLPVGGVVLLLGVAAAQGRLGALSRAAGSAVRRRRTA